MHQDSDITLSQRYECKYLVSPLIVPSIRSFLEPFVRPDAHAADRPGHRYPVCSLYLDTPDLRLYQQTACGEKHRFKLRVRTYSDDPDTPAFFEVKSRADTIVRKRRARVDRRSAAALLAAGLSGSALWRVADLDSFAHHAALAEARPVMRVRYMREAYESRGGDPVRITVDTELMHAVTLDGNLSHRDGRWVSTRVGGPIVEVKFTERFNPWVQDLVRTFGLKQQAVPKYGLSVEHLLDEGREATLGIAGLTLPARRA